MGGTRREPDLDLHPRSDSHDDGERIVHTLHAAAQSGGTRAWWGNRLLRCTGSVSIMTRRSFGGGEKASAAGGAILARGLIVGTLFGGEGGGRRSDRGSSEDRSQFDHQHFTDRTGP